MPEILKRAWVSERSLRLASWLTFGSNSYGGTPAVALFATKHRHKRESYRGSEFASRILADQNIPVIMEVTVPFGIEIKTLKF